MPRAFVTGATGFLGLNLTRRLVDDGWEVTAFHRPTSDLRRLAGLGVRTAVGDVRHADTIREAMPEGVDVVFHAAANTSYWSRRDHDLEQTNVDGAHYMVDIAIERGAKRFVYTSSAAAYGPEDGDRLDEHQVSRAPQHWIGYFRTKWLAEQEVRRGIEYGLNAVILNPANILGPYDDYTWGPVFAQIKRGGLPGVLPGGSGWCHVRNVVDAHLAAAARGRLGENYLLGAVHASFLAVVREISAAVGVRPPRRATPRALVRLAGRVAPWYSRNFTGKPPPMTPELAHVGTIDYAVDCRKAERELGYREVSLAEMVADTHHWLVAEGRL